MKRVAGVAAALGVQPATSSAHAFRTGTDAYEQFVEGAYVALSAPTIILPLVALGALVGLWRPDDGMPRIWPAFLAAQAVGLFSAPALPPGVAVAALAAGASAGAFGALLAHPPRALVLTLAALIGALTTAVGFQGHGLLELTIPIQLGLLSGANLGVSFTAGIAAFTLSRIDKYWLGIGWRVFASWTAAIMAIVLAFELRNLFAFAGSHSP